MAETKISLIVNQSMELKILGSKYISKNYSKIDEFYTSLVKSGVLKVIEVGWYYNPKEYDVHINIIHQDWAIRVITKSTYLDLLKKRRILKFLILKELVSEY